MAKKKTKMPYIMAALICEKVLREDTIPSLIRIVDSVRLPEGGRPPLGSVFELPLTITIMFKRGEAGSRVNFEISWILPSKQKILAARSSLVLQGPPQAGGNLNMPVRLQWGGEGLYWFDVSLNGRTVTRIPLFVEIGPPKTPKKL